MAISSRCNDQPRRKRNASVAGLQQSVLATLVMAQQRKEQQAMAESIAKVWQYFKESFAERPNEQHGSGLTAFKNEWTALSEADKQAIREGVENGTLTYA